MADNDLETSPPLFLKTAIAVFYFVYKNGLCMNNIVRYYHPIRLNVEHITSEEIISHFRTLLKIYGWCSYFQDDINNPYNDHDDLYGKKFSTFSRIMVSVKYWLEIELGILEGCTFDIHWLSLESDIHGNATIKSVSCDFLGWCENVDKINHLKLKNPKAYHALKNMGVLP